MNMKKLLILLALSMQVFGAQAQESVRETIRLDKGWKFAMGHAADPQKDFGCGTEYFNYLTKANSIHNEGPYVQKFDDAAWQEIQIPHDWVTTLPYSSEASHSHGYRTVGWKYPETSVGWYRKVLKIGNEDLGKRLMLRFDGIFRSAQVWFNGYYMGTEPSGYATQIYDITPYIKYGEENLICVRADASLEEGWFYEGAGIYRDVWLEKSAEVSVAPFGTFVYADLQQPYAEARLFIETEVCNSSLTVQQCEVIQRLLDANGQEIGKSETTALSLKAKQTIGCKQSIQISKPHLWSTTDPYLYQVETSVCLNGKVIDIYKTTTGIRDISFDAERGFILNGKPLKLKGVNLHQDHSGVGAAIPDALQAWRIKQLKKFGCNSRSDCIYMVLDQSESAFRRYEWLSPLYDKLALNIRGFVLNRFSKDSPFSRAYAAKRLGADRHRVFTVSASSYGDLAEIDERSLLGYRDDRFSEDMGTLAADVMREAGLDPELNG